MGKQFFKEWALWQQLSFCLCCGLVVTVLAGLGKLYYTRTKLQKFTKAEKGKQAQTPEMLEAQPISEEPKDDIPFGIRAIESGIEVDGVWISRTNTPVTSSRSSMTEVRPPTYRSQNNSQLELPKALLSHNSSRSTLDRVSTFDRAVSAERIHTNDSRSSSRDRDHASSSRGPPPMAPSAQYNNPNFHRNSSTLQALEGLDPASSSARYERNNGQMQMMSSSNSGNSRSSDEFDYVAVPGNQAYDAAYINPKHPSLHVPNDPRTDLDLLQSHRLSHVAETGQLTPRVRRPGYSGDWLAPDNTRAPHEIATANGIDFFVPQQKTPSPPPNNYLASTPEDFSFPPVSKGKQPMPAFETYTPEANPLPRTYQPRGPQYTFAEEPSHLEVQAVQDGQQQSQVLRKVNSGFEILRPGTLGEPPSPEDDKVAGDGEKRKSKRLQKRRGSSSASRTSHFVEQV